MGTPKENNNILYMYTIPCFCNIPGVILDDTDLFILQNLVEISSPLYSVQSSSVAQL